MPPRRFARYGRPLSPRTIPRNPFPRPSSTIFCQPLLGEVLLDDSVRLVRDAGVAGIDATLSCTTGMQHVFPIWAGNFPEADAAIGLIGNWVRARTEKNGE